MTVKTSESSEPPERSEALIEAAADELMLWYPNDEVPTETLRETMMDCARAVLAPALGEIAQLLKDRQELANVASNVSASAKVFERERNALRSELIQARSQLKAIARKYETML